ncbi:MAG TPA: hypothetical protein VH369_14975, partial [Bryobacteraceae bacterium]
MISRRSWRVIVCLIPTDECGHCGHDLPGVQFRSDVHAPLLKIRTVGNARVRFADKTDQAAGWSETLWPSFSSRLSSRLV